MIKTISTAFYILDTLPICIPTCAFFATRYKYYRTFQVTYFAIVYIYLNENLSCPNNRSLIMMSSSSSNIPPPGFVQSK